MNFENIHLSTRQFEDILEVVKENTGMAYRKGAKNIIIITGTMDQIEVAHKLLQCLVNQKVKLEKKVTNYGDNAGLTSVGMNELGNDKSNISGSNNFEVQPQFMTLLKLVCNDNLQEIEEKFCVQIECDENTSKVLITSKNTSVQDHFQKGCDAFIDLYQKFVPNIGREEVGLPKGADTACIQRAITTTEAINAMVCEKREKTLVVYAEKKSIKSLVQSLKEELDLTNDQSSKRTKRDQDSTRRGARDTSQQGQHHVLNNEVNLSLYQGDITDERVDAIVNAANDWLQHGGGVAAAIVRKGGRQIQDESDRITRQYGPLNVGCATYTSAGKLACRYVIHTVGPEWRKHGKENSKYFLRQACIESLHIAALQLQLSSIALTAISSGIFGMPKDICAEVMFAAIEEFSSSVDAEFSTLRDVRIVIIDKPTLSVFQEEFVKRYVTHEASAEAMSTKGRSSDGQETTSPLPNLERNAYQSKRNDSSISTLQTQFDDKTFSLEQREQNGHVDTPSVPTNSEEIEKTKHSTSPDSVKENDENDKKNSPPMGQLEEEEGSRNPEVTHEASAEAMSTKGRSSDGQETTSPLPNLERNAYQSKRNDSSISTLQTQFDDKTFSLEQREQNGHVDTPSVPTNSEEIEKTKHSTSPDSVKENDENDKKNSPPMGQLEEEEGSRNPEVTHEASAEAMSTKGRSSDGQETTSPLPNLERNAYQSKRNDSSISTLQTQFDDKTFSLEQREQNGHVDTPSVPTNSEEIEKTKHSTSPDSVKENDENDKKNSPPMGQLEEEEGSRNPEVNDPTSVVDPMKSKESTKYVFSGIGRGRGSRLAAKFTRKETTGNASTGKTSSEISEGGAPPPGLDVTEEGKILAKTLNVHVAGDQKSNVDETVKAKNAEENEESSSEDLHNVKQVQHLANANVDYENSQIQSGNVDRADKEITAKPHLKSNTSTRKKTEQNFSDKDLDADKQGPHYEIQEKDLSTPGKKGEQESDRLAEPTVNDNIKTKSSQDEMTSETAKEEMQSQRKLTLQNDSSTSCPNPSSEQSFSPQEVTKVKKDTVGERKNDEDSRSENQFGGNAVQICSFIRFKFMVA